MLWQTIFLMLFVCMNTPMFVGTNKTKILDVLDKMLPYFDTMRRLEGGRFMKGVQDPSSDTGEYPPHYRHVRAFYLDQYPVTVIEYYAFKMDKRKYKTHAESKGWSWVLSTHLSEQIKRKKSKPGNNWMMRVKGALWDKPEGDGSNIQGRLDHPVTHVSWYDAQTYCHWKQKRLPTEDEWEFAARGGKFAEQYPWGDRYEKNRMNTWQGYFPFKDYLVDGYGSTSPVHAFPPQNDYGMFDMLGNVWEWTKSRYWERLISKKDQEERYVAKGGSYLDSRDGDFNYIVRISNRMGQAKDYSAHNIGFRCARTPPEFFEPRTTPKPRERRTSPSEEKRKRKYITNDGVFDLPDEIAERLDKHPKTKRKIYSYRGRTVKHNEEL